MTFTPYGQMPEPETHQEADHASEFDEFFKAQVTLLTGYLRAQGCADLYTDDVVQESFLIVRRRWPDIRTGNPRAYLFRVAVHRAQRWKSKHQAATPSGGLTSEDIAWIADEVDAYLHMDSHLDCLALLHSLPPRQREVLCLRALLGFTEAETARILSIGRETVKSSYRDARRTLKERGAKA
jgi:RNA polymerase sigma factor (sigma-70 family)